MIILQETKLCNRCLDKFRKTHSLYFAHKCNYHTPNSFEIFCVVCIPFRRDIRMCDKITRLIFQCCSSQKNITDTYAQRYIYILKTI